MTRNFAQVCRFDNDVYLGTDTKSLQKRLKALEIATGLRELEYEDVTFLELMNLVRSLSYGRKDCIIEDAYRLTTDTDRPLNGYKPEHGLAIGAYISNTTKTLKFSHFKTSDNVNLYGLFEKCSNITSLDISNFNTSNVWSTQGMFANCSSLTSLDVTNLDTSQVTNMTAMFSGCTNLTSLDLSKFRLWRDPSMGSMFSNCTSLTTIRATREIMNKVGASDAGSYIFSADKDTVYDFTGYYDSGNYRFHVTGRTAV